ncbi:MAG: ribonuclease HII, partial [Elusimicrobia bacterium]|nr:ribonuclease HII [Elusimicrobiota bacterium]
MRASRRTAWLIGVDEAGRGPMAGPLVVAAVRLGEPVAPELRAARDSKLLSARRRAELFEVIRARAQAAAVAWAQPGEIDEFNVLGATLRAMGRAARRAAAGVGRSDCVVVVDGNKTVPGLELAQIAVVGGDRLCLAAACASIIAKVTR